MLRMPVLVLVLPLLLGAQAQAPAAPAGGAGAGAGATTLVVFNVTKLSGHPTEGSFTIEVHPDWAPLGAARFLELVDTRFFDGAAFFRVIGGFMAQFGLAADPAVTARWRGRPLRDDPAGVHSNSRGRVTFATSGPNSRTTQIFINFGGNGRLDGMGFAPFGQVVHGMAVVDRLYAGYGEGAPGGNGPSQGRITSSGAAYLAKDFPRLSISSTARVVRPDGGGGGGGGGGAAAVPAPGLGWMSKLVLLGLAGGVGWFGVRKIRPARAGGSKGFAPTRGGGGGPVGGWGRGRPAAVSTAEEAYGEEVVAIGGVRVDLKQQQQQQQSPAAQAQAKAGARAGAETVFKPIPMP
eukprot:SAG22_NODE_1609_length_4004_cov_7.732650_2_plen_350_part_00